MSNFIKEERNSPNERLADFSIKAVMLSMTACTIGFVVLVILLATSVNTPAGRLTITWDAPASLSQSPAPTGITPPKP